MNDGIDEERCDEQVRQLGRGVLLGRDLPHHVLRRQVLEEGIQECRMDPCLLGQDGGTGWGILILQQGLEDLVVLGNSRRDERERLHGIRQRSWEAPESVIQPDLRSRPVSGASRRAPPARRRPGGPTR